MRRFEDDGYGHKTEELSGAGDSDGVEGSLYRFADRHFENVATQEHVTEKTGYNNADGNKWTSKILDNPQANYVEHVGENWKTKDWWKEKWFDNKQGKNTRY